MAYNTFHAQSLATDMRRLFISTWPPSFSSHFKKEVFLIGEESDGGHRIKRALYIGIKRLWFHGRPALVQVMAWCFQATTHYLNLCWPRSVLPYDVTGSQWVNNVRNRSRDFNNNLSVSSYKYVLNFGNYIQQWCIMLNIILIHVILLFCNPMRCAGSNFECLRYVFIQWEICHFLPVLMYQVCRHDVTEKCNTAGAHLIKT